MALGWPSLLAFLDFCLLSTGKLISLTLIVGAKSNLCRDPTKKGSTFTKLHCERQLDAASLVSIKRQ
jgi:hypothetical protein